MALTAKQIIFVAEYIRTRNATRSAITAGYSKKNADKIGPELLGKTRIRAAIDKGLNKIVKKILSSAEKVIQELCNVAFADIGLVCIQNEEGDLSLRELGDMSRDERSVISSVQVIEQRNKDGEVIGVRKNFKFHDKLKALELLAKYHGILDGKGASSQDPETFSEELDTALTEAERKK